LFYFCAPVFSGKWPGPVKIESKHWQVFFLLRQTGHIIRYALPDLTFQSSSQLQRERGVVPAVEVQFSKFVLEKNVGTPS
jgi:hypothetical protein